MGVITTGQLAARRLLDAMAEQRVDLALIGDSNTGFSGGWLSGLGDALKNRFGVYASSIMWPGEGYVSSPLRYKNGAWAAANTPYALPATALTGTAAIAANSYTITGTGTQFTSVLVVGQLLKIGAVPYFARVLTIVSDTELTANFVGLSSTLDASPATASGLAMVKYPVLPAALAAQFNRGTTPSAGLFPAEYARLEAGEAHNTNGNYLEVNCPLDTTAALKAWYCWGSEASGAGSFYPGIGYFGAPSQANIVGGTVAKSTNTGEVSWHLDSV